MLKDKESNLPFDMRQYWGGVAKKLGSYHEPPKSWLPKDKRVISKDRRYQTP
jgi:hypothetical protein